MFPFDVLILQVLHYAAVPVGIYAFVHAALQRPDAFTAADKKSKPAWLGITGGGTLADLLFYPGGVGFIFWVAGLVAVLVYIVDVKPRVTEVQGGNSR